MVSIRQQVAAECQSDANALGPAFFDQHLEVVAEYAGVLARALDAMSQIAQPAYWLYFAFGVRRLDFAPGRQWLRDHFEKNWAKLIPVAKEVIEDEYRRARDLLG